MKQLIKEVMPHVKLFRDDKNGLAWIEDGRTGLGISVHPNIHSSGSVSGMRARGYWGKHDRVIRSHGFIYNIDKFVCDRNDPLEKTVAHYCQCAACQPRG